MRRIKVVLFIMLLFVLLFAEQDSILNIEEYKAEHIKELRKYYKEKEAFEKAFEIKKESSSEIYLKTILIFCLSGITTHYLICILR